MSASLPLTAFESYMWADDSPDHPTTALIEFRYSGRIDRPRLETALAATLGQHPLLRSLIDRSGRRPRWVIRREATPYLSWADEQEPPAYPGDAEHIDLTREIGLRVWVREGDGTGRVILQLHHACTDGVGVTNFVLDLLRNYDRVTVGGATVRRDEGLLDSRDRLLRHPWRDRLRLFWGIQGRVSTWRRSRPLVLADGGDAASERSRPMSAIRWRTLDEERLEGLLRAGHEADATLNDTLLRDLFLVLRDRCDCYDPDDECLCVCMPVNLREPTDAAMPAANKMMLTFLTRPPRACDDPDRLLRDLHRETTEIKTTRRGVRLLEVIRIIVAITGELPQRFLRKRSLATMVLSNLGRIGGRDAGLPTDDDGRFVAGGLTIDDILTAPNGRPGTAAVLVALTYAGRLTLCLWSDRQTFSEAAAERLLDAYIERLNATAGTVAAFAA